MLTAVVCPCLGRPQAILKHSMPLERGVALEKTAGLEGKEIGKGMSEQVRNVLPMYMDLLKNDQVSTRNLHNHKLGHALTA